jgi:TolA-binding protein
VEHVERLDEREKEIRGDTDDLDRQADELEQRGSEVDGEIDEAREEFARRQQSSDVPGAQEPDALLAESEESDVDPRPGTSETPGGADEGGQSTGNPPNDDAPAADEDDN